MRPCPECQASISDEAKTCPHCGRPIVSLAQGCGAALWIVGFVLTLCCTVPFLLYWLLGGFHHR